MHTKGWEQLYLFFGRVFDDEHSPNKHIDNSPFFFDVHTTTRNIPFRHPRHILRFTQYAQVIAGPQGSLIMDFNSSTTSSGSLFTLDTAGQLMFNGLTAQITPGTVSQIQFLNTTLAKRQSSSTVTCTTSTDFSTSPPLAVLSCSSNGQAVQQSCSGIYYLGSTLQCQPVSLNAWQPANAPALAARATFTPSPPIQLQAASPSYTYPFYAAYAKSKAGEVELAFAIYGHGAVFNLDGQAHLVGTVSLTGTGPPSVYVATFPIGSSLAPIAMMTGTVDSAYAPIACAAVNTTATQTTLSCADGANGQSKVLQFCSISGHISNILSVGTSVGSGCQAAVINVHLQSS